MASVPVGQIAGCNLFVTEAERREVETWLAGCPVELVLSKLPKRAQVAFISAGEMRDSRARYFDWLSGTSKR